MFHGFTRCNRVLHGVSRCYKVFQGVTRLYRVSYCVSWCYTVLEGVTRCLMVLHGVTLRQDPISRPLSVVLGQADHSLFVWPFLSLKAEHRS